MMLMVMMMMMMVVVLQAAICRCSQPLSGFSARCVEDESLLQAIRKANTASKYMFVVDMRPKASLYLNCFLSCRVGKYRKKIENIEKKWIYFLKYPIFFDIFNFF